ncbi:histone acetyl transferase HAT1 [Ceratocystis lukuohia]|uniref:Histone acetyltransferase type B catalytic subunit n=1 Tax=Ceratocystis lukuohia TaxID=2019550 RepID=A0ABR4MIH1_9PEZI
MGEIDTDEWSTNSTEATTISLVRISSNSPGHGLSYVASFNPTYTHQLFGEQEQIFGYKGLRMDIQVLDHCPLTRIATKFDRKFPKRGDVEADDIEDIWREVLNEDAFVSEEAFSNNAKSLEHQSPAGELCRSQKLSPNSNYEVWHGRLSSPAIYGSFSAIDFLSPLLIDGGSTITESPDLPSNHRWRIFSVYRKDESTQDKHSLVAYATVYTLYHFSPAYRPPYTELKQDGSKDSQTEGDEPCTRRIAQFVVLPPFQNQGIGQFLYATIFDYYYNDPSTKRLIVESPSNDFDDLRDVSDLVLLHRREKFNSIKIDTSYNPPKQTSKKGKTPGAAVKPSFEKSRMLDMNLLNELQRDLKMPPRQFQRLIEIHLMSQLPPSVRPTIEPIHIKPTAADLHQYRLWSLLVKERLVRQHGDALTELEHEERILRLNETLQNVGLDYARLLDRVQRVEARAKATESTENTENRKEKRKLGEDNNAHSTITADASAEAKRRKVAKATEDSEADTNDQKRTVPTRV